MKKEIVLVWSVLRSGAPDKDLCFIYLPLQQTQASCHSPGLSTFFFFKHSLNLEGLHLHCKGDLFHTDHQDDQTLHRAQLTQFLLGVKHRLCMLIAHVWESVVSHWPTAVRRWRQGRVETPEGFHIKILGENSRLLSKCVSEGNSCPLAIQFPWWKISHYC